MPEIIKIIVNQRSLTMDILEQYEKENPQELSQIPQWDPSDGEEYGTIIRLVMRLSGGRIANEQQANFVLVLFVVIAVLFSFFLVFGIGLDTSGDKAGIDQMMKLHPELIKK